MPRSPRFKILPVPSYTDSFVVEPAFADVRMRVLRKLLAPFRNATADPIVVDPHVTDAAPLAARRVPDRERVAQAAGEHVGARRYAAALALIDKALEASPRDPSLLFARGSTLFAWGRFIEARVCLQEVLRHDVRNADASVKLGWACVWTGKLDEALDAMRRATGLRPDDWAAHFGAGSVLRAQKQVAAGVASFERALELDPDSPHCLSNLVACEIEQGHLDAAEHYARRAIALDFRSASAWSDMGMVLCEQERFDDAISAFERAREMMPATTDDAPGDFVNLAICLLRAGRTHQALTLLETSLPAHPSETGHSQYALALLISGRLVRGFDQYEFRWMGPPLNAARPNFVKPVWVGQNIRGKTILLRAEQGFGDFIQFGRYARHVKALGATVLVIVREELREVAETLEGVDLVLQPNQPYPAFDFYANLLSLPRTFGTDEKSIPAYVPYLPVDASRVSAWATRFEGESRLKIGLVWAGSPTHLRDRFRSISLRQLAPLMGVAGVRFYSLQKGPAVEEIAKQTDPAFVVDLGRELSTFADTAAAISHLDLVIGVDTAVVHVAGALARPVWTMLPDPADWRWMEEREDSPWYPTMRLFRQSRHGDWDAVIRRVKDALEARVRDASSIRSQREVPARGELSFLKPVMPTTADLLQGMSRVAETRTGIVQHFPDRSEASESIALYGEYVQPLLDTLAPLVTPGMIAMEVGAGAGIHALWLARALGPGGHLLLYEADARQRQVLRQNLSANDVTNATVMRCWLEEESATISSGPETIDDLRLARLDWLKINAVADWTKILQGAVDTLWRLRPALCVTLADARAVDSLTAHVKGFGYACWICQAPLFNPANFNLRDEDAFDGRASLTVLALPEERGTGVRSSAYVTAHV
jgi:tetratricopeptide (TPR) repeat protein/predicted O-methyltransferase YrrM